MWLRLTLGPELDGPEGEPEAGLAGHQTEDGIGDPGAVEAADTLWVKVLQQADVQQVEIARDDRQGQACKQQVHLGGNGAGGGGAGGGMAAWH